MLLGKGAGTIWIVDTLIGVRGNWRHGIRGRELRNHMEREA